MNYRKLGQILGKILILEAILMMAPLAVSFIYRESFKNNQPPAGITQIIYTVDLDAINYTAW